MGMVLIVGSGNLHAQVRLKPHLYVGAGFSKALAAKDQVFIAETTADQNYSSINLQRGQTAFTRLHARLNLLQVWNLSLGYAFWGHHRTYHTDFPELWARDGKSYPHGDDMNMHAATVQIHLRKPPFHRKRLVPFLLGGFGRSFGSTTRFQYQFHATEDPGVFTVTKSVFEDKTYSRRALLYGAGAVVLRYGFLYVGVVDLKDGTLPVRRVLDAMIGITI
jgi:hypothetical protein